MADNNQNPGTQQQEPGAQQQPGTQQQNPGATIDYDKLAQALERGTAQKENAIMKSFFDQQGISEEDAKKLISDFKAQRAAKQTDLQKENEQLKAQILQGKVDTAISKAATELGIAAENVQYVTKLADLTGATNDKGEVDSKAVKEALEKVLTAVPAFKAAASDDGKGFQVGGKGSNTDKVSEADKALRAAFGLKN